MLQRVGPDLFEAPTGDTIRVIAIAANNGGVEAARFRYGPAALPATPILNHPGCSFVVKTAVTMFGCVVVFAPGAATARYDFFEVDANGTPIDLQESAEPGFGPLVQFRVRGVVVPVAVGVGPGAPGGPLGAAPPPPPPQSRAKAAKPKPKKKAARKKTAKKRAPAKKTATRKPAKRKPVKKKKTGVRASRTRTRGGR
jgi:hypothetical protein